MRILIIRHGDSDYKTDSLTEKGQREAELLGQRLKDESITKIYVSPLGRAQLTAQPTLDNTGLPKTTLDWLREFPLRVKTPFETKHHADTSCPWNMPPEEWADIDNIDDPKKWREADIYEGTGIVELYDDICENFDKLIAEHGFIKEGALYRIKAGFEDNTDTIAIFCHLGLGNLLLAHMSGISLPVVWHTLFLPTSSVTTVYMEMHRNIPIARARFVQVGDTSHLYKGGEPLSPCGLHTDIIR